ncbi:hypothetical protein NQ317_003852 [Molorchus minor]|uniref:PiggyBac transposable element-derived protein domain-containing protein n=1 Tax=Molorchus minor TaxID=1323400 RepID=A0ABQ9J2W7_9CUCU|nr:hypothetical protein NQ317_003852 [Molorchus minor]
MQALLGLLLYSGVMKANRLNVEELWSSDGSGIEMFRLVGASMFGFTRNLTIVSYIPKRKKNVLLISSLHHDDEVDQNLGKPQIILDYNSTKVAWMSSIDSVQIIMLLEIHVDGQW